MVQKDAYHIITPGTKLTIQGIDYFFYYEDSGGKVYEYFIEGKQFLYRVKAK